MNRYGFNKNQWKAAKAEGKKILSECAKHNRKLAYSDFAKKLQSIQLGPRSPRLFDLLGEISTQENAAGRGMLSALVVRKDYGQPGEGFFDLAQKLGRDISNKHEFWTEEVKRVYAAWSR